MKVASVELCPVCEFEGQYATDKDVMIGKCSSCGRPMLLCDKCYDKTNGERHGTCVNCPYMDELKPLVKKWEDEQIGKIVYWKNPDEDKKSDYVKIVGFGDGVCIIAPLVCDAEGYRDGDTTIEAYGSELEFLEETRQIEVLISHFALLCGWGK